MWAITPNGTGKPVGARSIQEGWELAEGETFTVAEDAFRPGMVLAENGTSLREATPEDLEPTRWMVTKLDIGQRIVLEGLSEQYVALLDSNADLRVTVDAMPPEGAWNDDAELLQALAAVCQMAGQDGPTTAATVARILKEP
jgi:hypothetical protein